MSGFYWQSNNCWMMILIDFILDMQLNLIMRKLMGLNT